MAKATWNGKVLAESEEFEIVEGNVYFPPGSVKWEFLNRGDRQYTCGWKGDADYYDIAVEGEVARNSAWSYPETKPAANNIKGYLAFDRAVQVER